MPDDIQYVTSPEIVWTALAYGRRAGRARVSFYASLRLGNASKATVPLSSYLPSGLDWPSVIQAIAANPSGFQVQVGSELRVAKLVRTAGAIVPDSKAWNAIIDGSTSVVPFSYTPAAHHIIRVPFEARTISSTVRSGRHGISLQAPVPLSSNVETAVALAGALDPLLAEVPSSAPSDLQKMWATIQKDPFAVAVFRAAQFYNRDQVAERRVVGSARVGITPSPVTRPPTTSGEPDFHGIIARFGDFPEMLRALGIVVDLDFDLSDAVVASLTGLQAVTPIVDLSGTPVSGWTQKTVSVTAQLDAASFYPVPTSASPLAGAMLAIDGPKFSIDSLDVDGAALQAVSGGGEIGALRSSGLTLFHDERWQELNQRLAASDVIQNRLTLSGVASTGMQGVLRGFRVDVSLDGSKWYSLCQRTQTATLGSGARAWTMAVTGDSFVKATSLTRWPDAAVDAWNLHESVFGWEGWSLVVPQTPLDGSTPTPNQTPIDWAFQCSSQSTVVPGSLLPLRFGTTYRLRARAVDLAGNSLSIDDPQANASTRAATFVRHEPVAPPALVLTQAVTEGESTERLVVRSNPADGQSTSEFSAALNLSPDRVATYTATSERHLAPPHVTMKMSEYHGALDPLAAKDPMLVAFAARKSEAHFGSESVIDGTTGSSESTGARMVTPPGVIRDGATPYLYPYDQVTDGGPEMVNGQYVVYPSATVRIPYLADPIASAVALHDDPLFALKSAGPASGAPTSMGKTTLRPPPPMLLGDVLRPWSGSWPEIACYRLRVESSPVGSKPSIDVGSGSSPMVVKLPPGSMVEVRYSSAVTRDADLGTLAEYAEFPADQALLKPSIQNGTAPTVTPYRSLTFVHATPRPLVGPRFATPLTLSRNLGDTFARLTGSLAVPCNDTGQVTLDATWTEPGAPKSGFAASTVTHAGRVTSFVVAYALGTKVMALPITPSEDVTVSDSLHQEFGDTKCRHVTYQLIGATRFKDYFPASYVENNPTVTLGEATAPLVVPSSARPAPLRVLEVVPTFRLDVSADQRTRRRVGRGLRVYVDGDWFSSGDGEQLAVLLADGSAPYAAYASRASGYGADPLWFVKGDLPLPLDQAHFQPSTGGPQLWSRAPTKLTLLELPGKTLSAVTFEPQFNARRGLWFFDLEMDVDTMYSPFLKLALARYQQDSCDPSIQLSEVCVCDPINVANDRTLTLTPGAPYLATLTGTFATNIDTTPPIIDTGTEDRRGGGKPPRATRPPKPPPSSSGRRVHGELQQTTSDGDLDWSTVNTCEFTLGSSGYSATFTPPALTGGRCRLLVTEVERHATDADVSAGTTLLHDGDSVEVPYRERIVYVDALPLP